MRFHLYWINSSQEKDESEKILNNIESYATQLQFSLNIIFHIRKYYFLKSVPVRKFSLFTPPSPYFLESCRPIHISIRDKLRRSKRHSAYNRRPKYKHFMNTQISKSASAHTHKKNITLIKFPYIRPKKKKIYYHLQNLVYRNISQKRAAYAKVSYVNRTPILSVSRPSFSILDRTETALTYVYLAKVIFRGIGTENGRKAPHTSYTYMRGTLFAMEGRLTRSDPSTSQ